MLGLEVAQVNKGEEFESNPSGQLAKNPHFTNNAGREDISGLQGYLQTDDAERIFPSGPEIQSKNSGAEASMGFITWIVVGLIAGWLAGQVMRGGGYGVLVDIILGIFGGVLGGWVFGLLGIWPGGGIIGAIIVAFIGAVILVGITRLLKRA